MRINGYVVIWEYFNTISCRKRVVLRRIGVTSPASTSGIWTVIKWRRNCFFSSFGYFFHDWITPGPWALCHFSGYWILGTETWNQLILAFYPMLLSLEGGCFEGAVYTSAMYLTFDDDKVSKIFGARGQRSERKVCILEFRIKTQSCHALFIGILWYLLLFVDGFLLLYSFNHAVQLNIKHTKIVVFNRFLNVT